MEIERKFLLDDLEILQKLKNTPCKIDKISQFYTHISPNDEIRYRKKNDKYFLTKKAGNGLARDEIETQITKKEYKKARKKRVSSIIKKNRLNYEIDGKIFSLDIYKNFDLYTLEVEFSSVLDANNFKLPAVFDGLNFKDITEDKKYKNNQLSIFGIPQNLNFNLDDVILKIKLNPNLKLNFPPFLRSEDALKIVFFQLYIKIKSHYKKYIKTKDPEALHDFRVEIRKSRSLLKLCKEVFDKNLVDEISQILKIIASLTNEKRDFDVLLKHFKDENIKNSLTSNLHKKSDNLQKLLDDKLKSNEIKNGLKEFENFIKTPNSGTYKSTYIKAFIAKIIKEQIQNISQKLQNLDETCDNHKFHEIRIEFKKLRYICESFSQLFDIRQFAKFLIKLKSIQEIFGNLQDRDIWLLILDENKNFDEKFLATYKEKIKKEIGNFRSEILEKKCKITKKLDKFQDIFKVYYEGNL